MRMSAESIKSFHGASSQLLKKIRYFSIPLPWPPMLFPVLSLSPVSCWTTFQTSLAPFPELLCGRQWSGISSASMAVHLGWFRHLLPIGKSSGGTDCFFLNSLTSKDSPTAPAGASTLEPLLEASYAVSRCSIMRLVNPVGCGLPAWQSWKTLHAIQKLQGKSSSTFSSNPFLLHKWHR